MKPQMKRGALHRCPVRGCIGGRLRWQAVCQACWARLPRDFRTRINQARAQKARHMEARAAIEAVDWLVAHPVSLAADRLTGEAALVHPPP